MGETLYQQVLFPQSPHKMPAPRLASSRDLALPPQVLPGFLCSQGFCAPICPFLNLFFSQLSMKVHSEMCSRFQDNIGSELLAGNQTVTWQWIQDYHGPGHRDSRLLFLRERLSSLPASWHLQARHGGVQHPFHRACSRKRSTCFEGCYPCSLLWLITSLREDGTQGL